MSEKKQKYRVKDQSFFDTNFRLFVIINEILGIRTYRLKQCEIEKRKWWKRLYVFILILIKFYIVYRVSCSIIRHLSDNSVIITIMIIALLWLSLTVMLLTSIKSEFVEQKVVVEMCRNFEYLYDILGQNPFRSRIKIITLISQSFFALMMSFMWIRVIVKFRYFEHLYYIFSYVKIDFLILRIIAWVYIIMTNLKLLNYELSKKLKSRSVSVPDLDIFPQAIIEKCDEFRNSISVSALNKIYLKLLENFDKICYLNNVEVRKIMKCINKAIYSESKIEFLVSAITFIYINKLHNVSFRFGYVRSKGLCSIY